MAVIRSSSAVVVGSQNANREWVYSQQQTVSAEGYSGQAFNPHFPHTTSGVGTTKNCTDCHLSEEQRQQRLDDAAARLRHRHGEFLRPLRLRRRRARRICTASSGPKRTSRRPPSAAICTSSPIPTITKNISKRNRNLKEGHRSSRPTKFRISRCAANISTPRTARTALKSSTSRTSTRKDFPNASSPRRFRRSASALTFARNSPHRWRLPSTLGIDPLRTRLPENEEQPISLIYAWVFVTDREEGLVMVSVGTLVDGDPANNFLDKEKIIRFNPDGKLTGAMHCLHGGNESLCGWEEWIIRAWFEQHRIG